MVDVTWISIRPDHDWAATDVQVGISGNELPEDREELIPTIARRRCTVEHGDHNADGRDPWTMTPLMATRAGSRRSAAGAGRSPSPPATLSGKQLASNWWTNAVVAWICLTEYVKYQCWTLWCRNDFHNGLPNRMGDSRQTVMNAAMVFRNFAAAGLELPTQSGKSFRLAPLHWHGLAMLKNLLDITG
jgi:hypothetical protein